MTNDRLIEISAAGSRRAVEWPTQQLRLSEFYERLRIPVRSPETMAEYLSLPKREQDNLKDVGGFVGGTLRRGVRKAGAVLGRDVITLDMDHIAPGECCDVLRRLAALGCGYAVYSTRKHSPAAPRLRLVAACDRTLCADEYEPVARKLAQLIDPTLAMFDRTTFEASRLMYWPSVCSDSEYVFEYADAPLLSADGMLGLYEDWKNVSAWPQCPEMSGKGVQKPGGRQEDPTEKRGIIGAFCRAHDIFSALEAYLPGVYEPTETPGRYTFTGGSTTGGAVIYDDGRFLYSHHATDPAGGQLCNSFDLVRLHRFGESDDEAKPDTPINKLPSYVAMCRLATSDEQVLQIIDAERYAEATAAFTELKGENETPAPESTEWMKKLKRNPNTGAFDRTTDNVLTILRNDSALKGKISLDLFAKRGMALGAFPWDSRRKARVWGDNDDSGIRWYLEKVYDVTGKDKIMDALSLYAQESAYDPVRDYLESLAWDNTPRIDTLFIDYLGAEDSAYVRAVSRKAVCAAVARVMEPGVKYDTMTILTGPQGIGKSTLLRKLGKDWFSDSLKTFEGKEACELVQGVWIVEVGELEAMARTEIGRIKQFLSQSEDIFRVPYGRRTELYPRRCVFFGTSNNTEYLRDKTGNRRFWPLDVGVQQHAKNVWRHLDAHEVNQIWAEAVCAWRLGEPLYLSGEIEETALVIQEDHRERSPREGLIKDFLSKKVPEDWNRWDINRRRMFWAGGMSLPEQENPVERDRVCALEVWCELLGGDSKYMRYSDAVEINGVITQTEGWKRCQKSARFGPYGVQKGFEKLL